MKIYQTKGGENRSFSICLRTSKTVTLRKKMRESLKKKRQAERKLKKQRNRQPKEERNRRKPKQRESGSKSCIAKQDLSINEKILNEIPTGITNYSLQKGVKKGEDFSHLPTERRTTCLCMFLETKNNYLK